MSYWFTTVIFKHSIWLSIFFWSFIYLLLYLFSYFSCHETVYVLCEDILLKEIYRCNLTESMPSFRSSTTEFRQFFVRCRLKHSAPIWHEKNRPFCISSIQIFDEIFCLDWTPPTGFTVFKSKSLGYKHPFLNHSKSINGCDEMRRERENKSHASSRRFNEKIAVNRTKYFEFNHSKRRKKVRERVNGPNIIPINGRNL